MAITPQRVNPLVSDGIQEVAAPQQGTLNVNDRIGLIRNKE
jgi:hypothetical protein